MAKKEVLGYVGDPRDIPWPRDKHGFTTNLKKEILSVVSRCGAFSDKKQVLDETLEIARQYLNARYKEAVRTREMKQNEKAAKEPVIDSVDNDESAY